MKPFFAIPAAFLLLYLPFPEAAAQSPLRLQRVPLQDVRNGFIDTPDPQTSEDDYFEGDDTLQEPARPKAEEIPPGQESAAETEDAEKSEDADKAARNTRSEATMKQLQELQKPMRDIQLSAGFNREKVPANQAADVIPATPEVLITSSGLPSLPERYTICITHRPLYYENANLERCGNGHGCFQNVFSGVRFFSTTLVLACRMGQQCPDELVCSLGDCKTCQAFPVKTDPPSGLLGNVHGFLSESAALAGFTLLVL